jgi:hypothetical protein
MYRKEITIVWILAIMLILELSILLFLVYFADLPLFLTVFVRTLKLLSPIFLLSYVLFLVLVIFGKGKLLVARLWKDFLRELFRLFILSFIIALITLIISVIIGTTIVLLLKYMYSLPNTKGILTPLRKWVEATFY